MQKKIIITVFMSALFAGGAHAQQFDANSFTLDESSAKIEQLDDRGGSIAHDGNSNPLPQNPVGPVINPPIPGATQLPTPPTGPVINPPLGSVIPGAPNAGGISSEGINEAVTAIDNIVNLAEKIWGIIERNQPVVNIATNYANAVPYGTNHWTQLQGWSKPSTRKYAFSMKNLYGIEVVKVVYQVHWTHSGNFQGKGKFLTGVTVEPLNVVTSWGYKVNLISEVPDSTVANVGTQEDPVASMQVQLKWTVHTDVKDITSKAIYYVQGDGYIQEMGTPFKKGLEEKSDRQAEELNRKLENVKF